MNDKKAKCIKKASFIISIICVLPIILTAVLMINHKEEIHIVKSDSNIASSFEYNGRKYKNLVTTKLISYTKDELIAKSDDGSKIYTIKYDDNCDFLYYSGSPFGESYIFTALNYDYDDIERVAENGEITMYKLDKYSESYSYGNSAEFINAIQTLDNHPELLEPAGDYRYEDFGTFYNIYPFYDNLPVASSFQNVKCVSIKGNQAYYMSYRYNDERLTYKVLDKEINDILIATVNNSIFEEYKRG